MHGARPGAIWSVPFTQSDYANLSEKDEREYLLNLKNEYIEKTESNLIVHGKKSVALKDSFYPLLLGAIILVALRYFQ